MNDEENKLNEAIKQDGIDTQSDILDELKRRYPKYAEQSDSEQGTVIDEQIEKQLARAASNGVDFCGKALNYINRLKEQFYQTEQKLAECENGYSLELHTANMRIRSLEQDKDEIKIKQKKQTAKEIYQIINSRLWGGIDNNRDIGGRVHNDTINSLCVLIKSKYCVEVD